MFGDQERRGGLLAKMRSFNRSGSARQGQELAVAMLEVQEDGTFVLFSRSLPSGLESTLLVLTATPHDRRTTPQSKETVARLTQELASSGCISPPGQLPRLACDAPLLLTDARCDLHEWAPLALRLTLQTCPFLSLPGYEERKRLLARAEQAQAERDCLTSQKFALEGDVAAATVRDGGSFAGVSVLVFVLSLARRVCRHLPQRLLLQTTAAKDQLNSELAATKAELENARLSLRAAEAERDKARAELTALMVRLHTSGRHRRFAFAFRPTVPQHPTRQRWTAAGCTHPLCVRCRNASQATADVDKASLVADLRAIASDHAAAVRA